MRKPLLTVAAIALTVTTVSCSREKDLNTSYAERGKDGGFVIRATMEPGSKSFISDEYGALEWNALDSIAVFGIKDEAVKMVTEQGGKTAVFKAEETISPTGRIYALYPYYKDGYIESGRIYTSLPSLQNAKKGSYDPTAFISAGSKEIENEESDINIGFYNICGGIRFTLADATLNIVKVSFQGNNQELLAGDISVCLDESIPYAESTQTSENSVTLENRTGFESSEDTDIWYYISCLPGEFKNGFTLKFTCKDGSEFETRCASPVTISRSRFISIRNADSQDAMNNIVTGEDLSVDGTRIANTYIINKEGFYKLPLVRMDQTGQYISGADACSVIWETFNTDEVPVPNSLIDSLRVKGHYMYFYVGDEAIYRGGNAMLAIHNEMGYVIWSWLIWVCGGYSPENTAIAMNDGSAEVMDRNLGAIDAGGHGMLFQWGRKDAFPGLYQSEKKMAINWTIELKDYDFKSLQERFIQNPWMFGKGDDWLYTADNSLWSDNDKTANDPCPYGWKVASAEILNNIDKSTFPKSGFMTKDGTLTGLGSIAKIWSSTYDGSKSKSLNISDTAAPMESDYRSEGHSVRCVKSL